MRTSPGRISTGRASKGPTSTRRTSPRRKLRGANLSQAYLSRTNLTGADLTEVDLTRANLPDATLSGATLSGATLSQANLSGATLSQANLTRATLVGTNFTGTILTGCHVYGISAWNLKLDEAKQENLIITPPRQPKITIDNLDVAPVHLPAPQQRAHSPCDRYHSFEGSPDPRPVHGERKVVLDALREELRQRDYTPVLFDFDKPASKDLTGTVQTLANMARFIIADVTDPSSVPHELATLVPVTVVPVQPVLLEGQREYAMFVDLKRRYHWLLEPFSYASPERLIADLTERVIVPAEAKARELRGVPPPTV